MSSVESILPLRNRTDWFDNTNMVFIIKKSNKVDVQPNQEDFNGEFLEEQARSSVISEKTSRDKKRKNTVCFSCLFSL